MHPVSSILRERDDGTTSRLSGVTTTSTMLTRDLASAQVFGIPIKIKVKETRIKGLKKMTKSHNKRKAFGCFISRFWPGEVQPQQRDQHLEVQEEENRQDDRHKITTTVASDAYPSVHPLSHPD
eukprot:scaffold15400_cov82-Skeletonema_dohrnii-CCMP3373.AAC.2